MHVALIDDDLAVTKIIAKLISQHGHQTSQYPCPLDAQRDYDNGAVPDFYLSDMRIPQDMQGPERFFNHLKNTNFKGRFSFMTGAFSEHDLEVIERTGASSILKVGLITNLEAVLAGEPLPMHQLPPFGYALADFPIYMSQINNSTA